MSTIITANSQVVRVRNLADMLAPSLVIVFLAGHPDRNYRGESRPSIGTAERWSDRRIAPPRPPRIPGLGGGDGSTIGGRGSSVSWKVKVLPGRREASGIGIMVADQCKVADHERQVFAVENLAAVAFVDHSHD